MADVVMPRLSDSMQEGTVLDWLKSVGDVVKPGDEIVEIETDKASMVYESDVEGVLIEILAQVGDTLAVGETIARVGDDTDESAPGGQKAKRQTGTVEPPDTESRERPDPGRTKISPLARRLARERGIDPTDLHGTGPNGRIVKRDVERYAPPVTERPATSTPAAESEATTSPVELSRMQQLVARRMAESKSTVPHFYLQTEIDMAPAIAAREQLKAASAADAAIPSFNDVVLRACALALTEFPLMNGSYRDGRFELFSRVNVGFAVAGDQSLIVPTVFDADKKTLGQIAAETRQLAGRARDGSITPPELSGGTFTVSNLGMFGVTRFIPVINMPQAGILAVGAIKERAVVREGNVVPGQVMDVTLACDHRIVYGADGAQFLSRVKALLERPFALAL